MRFGNVRQVTAGIAGFVLLAGLVAGCGPTQAEKDLAARMDAAASKTEAAANRAEAAARAASDAAQRAQDAASKAEAVFQHGMRK